MPTIFTRIVNGEIPCYRVAETEDYLAFLDINPLRKGHTLVIPKKEVDYLFDLDEETYTGLFTFAKKVAKAVEAVVECKRIGVAVIGLEVPHAHIHLAPINQMKDIDFTQPKLKLESARMSEIASMISSHFRK